jgi:Flp pilus assembly pilin Flp
MRRVWREQDGVLTFEWVLLVTLLAIGIVGGVSAVRDAVISELADVAGALVNVDQTYSIIGYDSEDPDCPINAPGWEFADEPDSVTSCRPSGPRPTP